MKKMITLLLTAVMLTAGFFMTSSAVVTVQASDTKQTSDTKQISGTKQIVRPEQTENVSIPTSYQIQNVPHIDQTVLYPTGCESISTVVAMQYAGYDITPEEYIDNYLPRGDFHVNKEGKSVAPGLDDAFLGDPYTYRGYGCYPKALIKAFDKMGISDIYDMWDVSDRTMEELCSDFLIHDIPVIFWATCGMSYYETYQSWIDEKTGKPVIFYLAEHCLVLIGYDEGGYYFSDSLRSEDVVYYEKSQVEQCHALLENQAAVFVRCPYPLKKNQQDIDELEQVPPPCVIGEKMLPYRVKLQEILMKIQPSSVPTEKTEAESDKNETRKNNSDRKAN